MLFAATFMELVSFILSEVSQKDKDKYHMITYMWNLIYGTNAPIYRKETITHGHGKQTCACQGGGGGNGIA